MPVDRAATSLFVLTDPKFAGSAYSFDFFMGAFEDATSTVQRASDNIQLIPFHPMATYSEVPGDDAGDFAARSPYPLFHLLRESDVRHAEERWARAGGGDIQEANAARLRGVGFGAMAAELSKCREDAQQ